MKRKVVILALHLGYGGVEKAITNLANGLIDKYDVTIVSTYKLYNKPIFELDKKVKITYLIEDLTPNKDEWMNSIKKLNIKQFLNESITSFKVLKLKKTRMINYIKECRADVIISTRDIHNKWLGEYSHDNILKIGWEHNHHHGNKKYIKKIINSVKYLDYFVLVSKDLNNFYKDKVIPKTYFIPNSLDYIPDVKSNLKSKRIISIGRLSPEKGFIDLIKVFNEFSKIHPDWSLDIVGDGPERKKIEKMINDLNLNDKIIMHGFLDKKRIDKLLVDSSIYVMTSLTESFGIVLLEAFSYGVPAIAFDTAEGAREIVDDNWNGYLIKGRDISGMVKRMSTLAKSFVRRKIMGDNAYKKALNFDNKTVSNEWIQMIEEYYDA